MLKALLLVFISISFTLSAQNLLDQKISVSFNNETLLHCVKKIESHNDVHFSYHTKLLKSESKTITQTFTNVTISAVLQFIFKGTDINFKLIGNQITLYKNIANKQVASLSGYVINAQSHEKLIGARIYFPSLKQGCLTNAYGYFKIDVPKGVYQYKVESLGMYPLIDTLQIDSDLTVNVMLNERKILLETVEVTSEKKDTISIVTNDVGTLNQINLNNTQITHLPASTGIADVTKNIQQQAGVQPALDGSSSYMVRGVQSGNNLILLDEIPIYHPNHLLGLYSIINTSAIKSTTFYKDYIPAKFGTRNSSVLNIYTKEGDMQKYHLTAGIGANVPHMDVEGPIIKDKMSFFVSVRKSFDALSNLNLSSPTNLPAPNFYDVTLKLNYNINFQNRIFLTSYFGDDAIDEYFRKYKWGNKAIAFRWNKVFSDKMFSNLTLIYNTFNYKVESSLDFENNYQSGQKVNSNQLKYDVTYYVSNKQKLNFGWSTLNIQTKTNGDNFDDFFLNRNSFETALYATYKKTRSKKMNYEFGVRLPFYFHIGTNDSTYYLMDDFTYQPVNYIKGKWYDFNFSVDPRFIMSYQVNAKNTFQLSAIVNTQFTHVIMQNTTVFPVEIWTTSSKYLKPERNFQLSLGLVHTRKYFKSSIILFARHLTNVIDFAQVSFKDKQFGFESNLLSGTLNVAGVEFTTQFQLNEKYNGALAYTFNYGLQKVDGINNNFAYTPNYFRPHYFSLNQYYVHSNKWEFGANFILHSKTALTLPTGKTTIDGFEYPLYDIEKNNSYLPFYHRLDLTFKRTLGIKKQKNRGYLTFTFVNIYGRENISNAFIGSNEINTNKIELKTQNYTPLSFYITYFIKL